MTNASPDVPVTMGSPSFRSLALDGFSVVEAWFPASDILAEHSHDRACVAVMLDGSFDLHLTGKAFNCPPSTIFTEPAGETHSNFIGPAGAHVVVVQPDPERAELLRPFAGFLDQATCRKHAGMADRALRLVRELDAADDLSTLAAEGVVLEMLATLARVHAGGTRQAPPWLLLAQEILHARFGEPIRTADVAEVVGVHPAHLTRVFRRHFNLSMGSYVRGLRLDWAARELAHSEVSISAVALAAGFADQSHFTRFFRRHTGLTPYAYRQTMRRH